MYTCKVLILGHLDKDLLFSGFEFLQELISQVRSNIVLDVDNSIEKVALGLELPHSSIRV
jgi:hypothetical protein